MIDYEPPICDCGCRSFVVVDCRQYNASFNWNVFRVNKHGYPYGHPVGEIKSKTPADQPYIQCRKCHSKWPTSFDETGRIR